MSFQVDPILVCVLVLFPPPWSGSLPGPGLVPVLWCPPVRRCAWFHPGPGRWWCSVSAFAKSARVDRGRHLPRCIPSARAGGRGLPHRRAAPTCRDGIQLISIRAGAGRVKRLKEKQISAARPPLAAPRGCRASRRFQPGRRYPTHLARRYPTHLALHPTHLYLQPTHLSSRYPTHLYFLPLSRAATGARLT